MIVAGGVGLESSSGFEVALGGCRLILYRVIDRCLIVEYNLNHPEFDAC